MCKHAEGAPTVPDGSSSVPDVSAAVVARHPVKLQVAYIAVDSLAGRHLAVAGLHDLQASSVLSLYSQHQDFGTSHLAEAVHVLNIHEGCTQCCHMKCSELPAAAALCWAELVHKLSALTMILHKMLGLLTNEHELLLCLNNSRHLGICHLAQ